MAIDKTGGYYSEIDAIAAVEKLASGKVHKHHKFGISMGQALSDQCGRFHFRDLSMPAPEVCIKAIKNYNETEPKTPGSVDYRFDKEPIKKVSTKWVVWNKVPGSKRGKFITKEGTLDSWKFHATSFTAKEDAQELAIHAAQLLAGEVDVRKFKDAWYEDLNSEKIYMKFENGVWTFPD